MLVRVTILLALLGAFAQARPSVVASIQPYAALLEQIAGGRAEVLALLDPASSPHTYDPSPRDVARVAEADLIVLNGGLDSWLLDLVEASGSRAPVIVAMSELAFEPITGHAAHDEAPPGQSDYDAVNPHIWLDPILMARLVPRLGAALAEVDPGGAPEYRARSQALAAGLRSLDAELRRVLRPARDRPFVPFHDAWPYFARRYGLDLVAELEPAPGREPGPRAIAGVIELVRRMGGSAIFGEVQLPAAPAQVVARSAGVPLFMLDPLGKEGESYQDMLRANARTIAGALENH